MAPLPQTAFVLGAGLGTRLKLLTARRPKPLVPVVNKPLITFAFDHLIRNGIRRFVVNTHHCPEVYDTIFPGHSYEGIPVVFRHEPVLLETGGGIKNIADLLTDGPFVVYNGDILSDLPLEKLLRHHAASGNEVTLALRSSGGPLAVTFDHGTGRITDIGSRLHPDIPGNHLFTGIYVVNPEFCARIPAGEVLSVIPIFRQMIEAGEKLGGVVIDEGKWWDLGSREQYLAVHRYFKDNPLGGAISPSPWIAPTARIAPSACIAGATAVGPGAVIGDGAVLEDSILWENAEIASGASLRNCIVTAGSKAGGTHDGADF